MARRITIREDWYVPIKELADEFHKRPSKVLTDLLEYSSIDNLRADYEDQAAEELSP